jgi:hypothetical protein
MFMNVDTTENISTRRSKKLYEITVKMSKYTPRSFQLLEGSNEFSLLVHVYSKYQTCYNHTLYGGWPFSLPVPDVGIELSFCGNNYMIAKSKIDVANLRLFIL